LTREIFPGATNAPRRSLRTLAIPTLKIAIDAADVVLDERIAARVDQMLAAGFVDEAERVGAEAVASDAVGYPQALAYARGFLSWNELRTLLIRGTKRYAKRQRTWFRGEPEMRWVAPDDAAHAAATLPGWS